MKTNLLILAFFVCTQIAHAQIPNFEWVKQFGDSAGDDAKAVAIDAAGNIYVTGSFGKTVDFDPGPAVFNLTSAVGLEIFVVKFNALGDFEWAVQTNGNTSDMDEMGIACNTSGNVFITGHFHAVVDFDPGALTYNLTSNGGRDIFLWNLDSGGNFVWAKNIGSTASSINSEDVGYDIKVDNLGNIYTIGSFALTADFDPGAGTVNLNAGAYSDIFILKLDANGEYVYAKNFGGTNYCIGNSIAIDDLGNVFATGSFSDTVDFDPGPAVFDLIAPRINPFVPSDPDIFVLKLNPNGDFIWAQNFGSTKPDYGYAIAVDATGNVYTTGEFDGTVDFSWGSNTYNLTTSVYQDVFILKSDSAGTFNWAKQIVSSSFYDEGRAITSDNAGNVYITGSYSGTADLDPGIDSFLVTSSGRDIFILKLDENGNFIWGNGAGGIQSDIGEGIVLDANEDIISIGSFSRTADFDFNSGIHNLTAVGTVQDIYILKMDQGPVGIADNSNENSFTVYPNPANNSLMISQTEFNENCEMKIIDVTGKVIYETQINGTQTKIDVRNFDKGIYFVQIFNSNSKLNNFSVRKVVVN